MPIYRDGEQDIGVVIGQFNADNLSVNLEGVAVQSFLYGYDSGATNWDRITMQAAADNFANPTAMQTLSFLMGWDGSNWDRCSYSAAGLLVDTELPAAAALGDGLSNPTTPMIGANLLIYNGTTWDMVREGAIAGSVLADTELPAAASLADGVATPTTPMVGANLMLYNGTTWDMGREGASSGSLLTDVVDRAARDLGKVDIAVFDTAITPADGVTTPTTSPPVASFGMVYNGTTWDMLREGAISGSVIADTELPAAAALSDNYANPTVPGVGAFMMGWDGGNWDRLSVGAAGLLVNTELPAAAALADGAANPTTPTVGAALLGWNTVTWDRLISTVANGLDVDVTRVIPGTAATCLGKAVDAGAGGSDTGVAALAVRDDALGGLTPAAGDYTTLLVDANGALWTHDDALDAAIDGAFINVNCNIAGVDFVGGAGAVAAGVQRVTLASNDPAVTALELLDNAVYVDDADWADGSSSHLLVGGLYQSTPQTVTDGDVAPFEIDVNGRIIVSPSTALDVSAATVTVDTELPAAGALGDTVANPTTPVVGACLMGYNGATWERVYLTGGAVPVVTQHPESTLTDAHANPNAVLTGSFLMGWNGTTWDRLRSTIAAGLVVDTELPAAAALTDDFATPTAPAVGAFGMVYDGTTWDMMRGTSADGVLVNLGANNDVTTELPAAAALADGAANPNTPTVGAALLGWNTATWDRLTSTVANGLDVDVTRVGGAVTIDGTVAHDGLDSGGAGPVKIGGRAQEPEAQPEEVADNDRVDALFDRNGYQRVRGDLDPSYAAINCAVAGDNEIVAAQAAGKRIAVWAILIVSDGTTDVRFEDGAGAGAFTGQVPLQAREGYSISAGGIVPLFVGSAATALSLELTAAVNVHGFVSYTVMDD